jgi:uncharacterized membrane protein
MEMAIIDIWIVTLVLIAAMVVAWIVGRQMGSRMLQNSKSKPSKFDDASTALLGLLLAFSFGVSFAKYDQRRLAVVADSNSIGDFYTCASLLKEPSRTRLQTVIREYARLRFDLARGSGRPSDIEGALLKFGELHTQMTAIVYQALIDETPIAVSLANTLNAVTSNQASRLAAYRDRLPTIVVVLLLACAIITTLLIGREQGATGNFEITGTVCFIILVALAVFVTLDLNSPAIGLIRASQEPAERVLSSMLK